MQNSLIRELAGNQRKESDLLFEGVVFCTQLRELPPNQVVGIGRGSVRLHSLMIAPLFRGWHTPCL